MFGYTLCDVFKMQIQNDLVDVMNNNCYLVLFTATVSNIHALGYNNNPNIVQVIKEFFGVISCRNISRIV